MRRIGFCVGICLIFSNLLKAQVGINTIDPKAQLDIASSNSVSPQITDGILIPRIENFPATQPTVDQDGMLVYLKKETGGFMKGFYYWDSSQNAWTSLTASSPSNFYEEGTTDPSEGVIEGIYRFGNIGIGEESPEVRLKVVLGPEIDHSIRTALEIDNSSSAPINVTYGILNNNRSLTDSRKYGIKTNVSAAGKGVHYGIYNEVYQNSVEEMYGIYNKVGRTYGASKNHYGIYSEIGTQLGSGYVFGLYSTAFGNYPGRVYAGYFAGRLGIGSTFESQFVFPTERGKRDQTLVLDEVGNLEWRYGNYRTYTSTASATGNYIITDETYTLRINDQISSITIPDASLNEGRIIVLIAWTGISVKSFTFLGGDDIWDTTTGNSVSSISGGERMTIQSAGNRWIILNRQ